MQTDLTTNYKVQSFYRPILYSGVVVFPLVSGRAAVISNTAFNSDIVFLR